jgi:ribosomal protein S18 acetylase RimI-like enzyme
MVARGQTGQWGDRPFSERPETRRRVAEMARHDGLWIAERDGAPVGALIVGARPAHVHPVDAPELYIELLITSRAHAGNDIGGRLVRHADALAAEAGVPVLRVDCWAGAPQLVGWYERQGFVRAGTFDHHGWIGQVFEKAIPAAA